MTGADLRCCTDENWATSHAWEWPSVRRIRTVLGRGGWFTAPEAVGSTVRPAG